MSSSGVATAIRHVAAIVRTIVSYHVCPVCISCNVFFPLTLYIVVIVSYVGISINYVDVSSFHFLMLEPT